MSKKYILILISIYLISLSISFALFNYKRSNDNEVPKMRSLSFSDIQTALNYPTNTQAPTPSFLLITPPQTKILHNDYHVFQTFNNCGPAALSMALSYYQINKTQEELGQILRPYQNPLGDNDDKSVTLDELAGYAKENGFITYHRPNGNIDMVRQLLTYDIPVITRTWLNNKDDIGHYRVIKGYDDQTKQLLQDDSLQGSNIWYAYDEFNQLWKKFNYEYLILVPSQKEEAVKHILGENVDPFTAWSKAASNARDILNQNPNDIDTRFNLSVALYHISDYENAVLEYEKIESELPFRTLWYQIEPILAYYELNRFDKVITITNQILNNHNRAYSELYIVRGDVFKKQGDLIKAKEEYQKAVFYNQNLQKARDALNSIE